jgi:hypothetical protein
MCLWVVWMRIPTTVGGWSMVAKDLYRADAERMAKDLLFEARAMPADQSPDE